MKNNPPKKQNHTKLTDSIHLFLDFAEKQTSRSFPLTSVYHIFNENRRRIYDIVNVLEAIGYCKRYGSVNIEWKGRSSVIDTIREIQKQNSVIQPDVPLNTMLPHDYVGLGQLTTAIIIIFHALQTRTLNIKDLAFYLSRKSSSYKTILCKIYQVFHILESIGFVEREGKKGNISLVSDFYNPLPLNGGTTYDPTSLIALLNRPVQVTSYVIKQRLTDFQIGCKQNEEAYNKDKQSQNCFVINSKIQSFPSL